jgi:hypothetical protein
MIQLLKPNDERKSRLDLYKVAFEWNWRVDPARLVENGEEPELAVPPMGRVLER